MHLRLMLISQVLLLLLVVESSWGLRCILPCDVTTCPEKLKCRGGKVLGPCKCCYVCAKQEGETCGGVWNQFGTCDKGLECREEVCTDLGPIENLWKELEMYVVYQHSRVCKDVQRGMGRSFQKQVLLLLLLVESSWTGWELLSKVLVLLLLLVVESSWGLRCILPCDVTTCPEKLKCRGGKVLDPCKCCYECARQKGERCGREWNVSGTCDKGLECREDVCTADNTIVSLSEPRPGSNRKSVEGAENVLLLLLVVESSWGLRCLPCDVTTCPEKLKCRGGKVLDPCQCCYVCAKQKGETCGGAWNLSGTCDKGLECREEVCT
ncbi:hypothetical protein NFI96_024485, partial [Prochilodus magdalenae]